MANENPYPGNPALSGEAREKILSTFRHSLNLFKAGKIEDCAVGCDFILKMDPRFGPARQLMEKARNPQAAVDVAALEAHVADTQTPLERIGGAAPDRILIEAIEAYADRDFDRAIERANRVLSVLPGNGDAREILEKATRKRDLQPHIENFRQRTLFALESGQKEEARLNLERLKSLDPEHPEIEPLSARIAASHPPEIDVSLPESPREPFSGAPSAPEVAFHFDPVPAPEPPPAVPGGGLSGLENLNLDDLPPPSAPPADAEPFGAGSEAEPFGSVPAVPAPPAFSNDIWTAEPAPSSGASAAPSPGTGDEIAALLRKGDELAARGNPQAAIEAWSEIFLVDLENAQAAARIEAARARMVDSTRRVSEATRAGRSLFDAGQFSEARERFLEALAIDENDPTARSFLQRVEDELARPRNFDLSDRVPATDVLAEEETPEERPRPEPRAAEAPAAAEQRPARRSLLLPAAAAALVVVIGAGLFFIMRSRSEEPPPPVPRRAQAAPGAAGVSPPVSTQPPAAAPASSTASAPVSVPTQDAVARRSEAETALADHRYIAALAAVNMAASAYPDDAEFRQEMARAAEKVQEIAPAVKLYNDGDYDTALPILWRIYQADHENADARSYLTRAYYNQGVIYLQGEQFAKAAQAFGEAAGLDPRDALAARQRDFAKRYTKKPVDPLARIYTKYLRPRP
jgi:tetratricopeptide (TPR) repeat protein